MVGLRVIALYLTTAIGSMDGGCCNVRSTRRAPAVSQGFLSVRPGPMSPGAAGGTAANSTFFFRRTTARKTTSRTSDGSCRFSRVRDTFASKALPLRLTIGATRYPRHQDEAVIAGQPGPSI